MKPRNLHITLSSPNQGFEAIKLLRALGYDDINDYNTGKPDYLFVIACDDASAGISNVSCEQTMSTSCVEVCFFSTFESFKDYALETLAKRPKASEKELDAAATLLNQARADANRYLHESLAAKNEADDLRRELTETKRDLYKAREQRATATAERDELRASLKTTKNTLAAVQAQNDIHVARCNEKAKEVVELRNKLEAETNYRRNAQKRAMEWVTAFREKHAECVEKAALASHCVERLDEIAKLVEELKVTNRETKARHNAMLELKGARIQKLEHDLYEMTRSRNYYRSLAWDDY